MIAAESWWGRAQVSPAPGEERAGPMDAVLRHSQAGGSPYRSWRDWCRESCKQGFAPPQMSCQVPGWGIDGDTQGPAGGGG